MTADAFDFSLGSEDVGVYRPRHCHSYRHSGAAQLGDGDDYHGSARASTSTSESENENEHGASCLSFWRTRKTSSRQNDPFIPAVPISDPSPKDLDALLTRDMKSMSLLERTNVYHDMHGGVGLDIDALKGAGVSLQSSPTTASQTTSAAAPPDPITRATSGGTSSIYCLHEAQQQTLLDVFEHELAQVSRVSRAYQIAYQSDPSYVQDKDFWLAFLNAEATSLPSLSMTSSSPSSSIVSSQQRQQQQQQQQSIARKAATRFIKFLEEKLLLFGPNKLTKDITIDDLEDEDIKIMESGAAITCTQKDRSGRPIFIGFPALKPNYTTWEHLARILFYQMMTMYKEDSIARIKGIVCILYIVDESISVVGDREEAWNINRLRSALPIKQASHLCYNNIAIRATFPLVHFALSSIHGRTRLIKHFGTHVEVQYKLLKFGIPVEQVIPIQPNTGGKYEYSYDLLKKYCLQWLDSQKESSQKYNNRSALIQNQYQHQHHQEEQDLFDDAFNCDIDLDLNGIENNAINDLGGSDMMMLDNTGFPDTISSSAVAESSIQLSSSSSHENADKTANKHDDEKKNRVNDDHYESILEPGEHDVIFGRGKGIQDRPGNARLRLIVDMHVTKYEAANKYAKTEIAERVIRIIHESSGRFLKQVGGNGEGSGWEEMDELAAREKVSRAFRAKRSANNGGGSSNGATKKKSKQ